MPDEIAQLLENLVEGEPESSGAFQLDPQRLAQEIKLVQKNQPATWLIKSFQFVLSTAPRSFQIQIDPRRIGLYFDPTRWQPELLELGGQQSFLPEGLARTRAARHLRQLSWLLAARPDIGWDLASLGSQIALTFQKTKYFSKQSTLPSLLRFEVDSPGISWSWPEWVVARNSLSCPATDLTVNGRPWTGGARILAEQWPTRVSRNHTLWEGSRGFRILESGSDSQAACALSAQSQQSDPPRHRETTSGPHP